MLRATDYINPANMAITGGTMSGVAISGGSLSGVALSGLSSISATGAVSGGSVAATGALTGGSSAVTGTESAGHFAGSGGTPTVVVGPGAGTGPTISISGTDSAFRVTLTTGILAVGLNAVLFTVTFANAFAAAPHAVFAPANVSAALLSGATANSVSTTQTTVVMTSGTTAIGLSTLYVFDFVVVG